MTLEASISTRFADRLRKRSLMVIHDSDGRYREIVLGMADNRTTVLDCGGDLLDARERALESLAALGEYATCKQMLALYVPEARSLEDSDLCADPTCSLPYPLQTPVYQPFLKAV